MSGFMQGRKLTDLTVMEVKILSTETIKPAPLSIPHHHPKTFPISLLDKLFGQFYTPIIFFYTFNNANVDTDVDVDGRLFDEAAFAVSLKVSLWETLGRFYVMAGRVKNDMIQFSDDDGALFLEAAVNITMDEFLKKPNLEIMAKLVPFPYISSNSTVQLAVQLNAFADSSGMAVGVSLLHSIIDGATMSCFIRSWAASCRGSAAENTVCGDYGLASSLFPHRELPNGYTLFSRGLPFMLSPGERSCTRRFVFDAMAISKLKAKAKSASVPNPTSVEAVTCFIWKCAMKVATLKSAGHKLLDNMDLPESAKEPSFDHRKKGSALIHVVNMRTRTKPPLPEATIGNIVWRTCSYYEPSNTGDTKLEDLEHTLRQSLSKIDTEFVGKIIGDEGGFEIVMSSLQQLHENYRKSSVTYLFTSWRNMGMKEVDFGWGKPVWIATGGKAFDSGVKNFVILMETMRGDGIEAWIVLEEEAMKLLELDFEFLEFASLNPSVILA